MQDSCTPGRALQLDAGRQVTVLRTSGAAADHPIHPAFAEGAYLTAVLLHVH